MATDAEIANRIEKLVQEEHSLWEAEGRGDAGESERQRLDEVKVMLDQCWDLLRQRRAREEFGLDPDVAEARPEDVVEGYQQ
jgi:hypothetical protein